MVKRWFLTWRKFPIETQGKQNEKHKQIFKKRRTVSAANEFNRFK